MFFDAQINSARTTYYASKIEEQSCNNKAFFQTIGSISHTKSDSVLPDYTSLIQMLEKFSNYFVDKIAAIRLKLYQSNQGAPIVNDERITPPPELSSFTPSTVDEVVKLIKQSATKSCQLDPIPTHLLKENLEAVAPIICDIVNLSLKNGIFPIEFKKAIVCSLIKKSTLDKNILKNYRPVSNLSFISKITEKIVASRFKKHLLENSLHEPKQSAYRSHHSTETALISVTNDIMCAVDQKKAVVLVLLDLSAAFDTIDHSILQNRLHKRYGITGTALSWFETYLTDRCQIIQLNGESSDEMRLQFGVPQGSVLGLFLFTSYTAPLGEIARRHGVELHLYADNTQVYMSFSPLTDESTTRTFQRIEACIAEIRMWLKNNKLMLNDDKTDVLVISSVSMRSKLPNATPENRIIYCHSFSCGA